MQLSSVYITDHVALRLAAAKLPIRTEFITKSTPPRLGREVSDALRQPSPVRGSAPA